MEHKPPLRFRKLRIAWTVAWGLLAVLLCVLWVRSYRVVTAALFDRSPTLMLMDGQFIYNSHFAWDGRCRKTEHIVQISRDSRVIVQQIVPGGSGIEVFKYGWRTKLWPLALLGVLTTAFPWIRLFNRFSLRTLLIATTLVAVVLGWAAWIARQ